MLDFFHTTNSINNNYDVQTFAGLADTTLSNWQMWRKPRGAKMIYILAVGGGASGGCGVNTGTTSGAGAGGGSGGQSSLLIPAMLIPDTLYIQIGQGGKAGTPTSGGLCVAGLPTYIAYEADTTQESYFTLLLANYAPVSVTSATTTTGGTAGPAASAASINNMDAARGGIYTLIVGQAGVAGGASGTATANNTIPTTGIIVSGGNGGGSANTGGTSYPGGYSNTSAVPLGSEFIPQNTVLATMAGIAGVTTTPAGNGNSGFICPHYIMNFGGFGGGGDSGIAGSGAGGGGTGAPGCGGGGAGGSTLTNSTLGIPGNGGDGFVIIISM